MFLTVPALRAKVLRWRHESGVNLFWRAHASEPASGADPRPSSVCEAQAGLHATVNNAPIVPRFNAIAAPVFASDYISNCASCSVVVGPANTHRVELETLAFYNRDSVAVFAPGPVS